MGGLRGFSWYEGQAYCTRWFDDFPDEVVVYNNLEVGWVLILLHGEGKITPESVNISKSAHRPALLPSANLSEPSRTNLEVPLT